MNTTPFISVAKAQQLPNSHPCHVCVVQWSDEVWRVARFRRCSPDNQLGQPFVYGGMAGLDPAVRFDKHSAGIPSNGLVRQWGLHLLPTLCERYNPMPDASAQTMEIERGTVLRQRGYGIGRRTCGRRRAVTVRHASVWSLIWLNK